MGLAEKESPHPLNKVEVNFEIRKIPTSTVCTSTSACQSTSNENINNFPSRISTSTCQSTSSTSTSTCQCTSKNINNINENVEVNFGIEPIQISNSRLMTTIPLITPKSTTTINNEVGIRNNNMNSPTTNNSDDENTNKKHYDSYLAACIQYHNKCGDKIDNDVNASSLSMIDGEFEVFR